jgi:hypothetical protein
MAGTRRYQELSRCGQAPRNLQIRPEMDVAKQLREEAGKCDYSFQHVMREGALEIDRLHQALLTVKINLMRTGFTKELEDYIDKQLQGGSSR